ncbi:MAG TPA: hypothetical protein VKR27_08515, partial [Acidimicrobiales bacterium]|nr:hypothetical protein [Acidimicrobiales bacterium]
MTRAHLAVSAAISAQHAFPYLTAIVLVPVGAAVAVMCLPSRATALIRVFGVGAALAVLGIAVAVLDVFRTGYGGYQMVTTHAWLSSLG